MFMKTKLIALCFLAAFVFLAAVVFFGTKTEGQEESVKQQAKPNTIIIEPNIPMAPLETIDNMKHHGVEIVVGSDPRFDTELDRLIVKSRPDLAALINAAKPLSLLVVNQSDKDIVGCGLKWDMKSEEKGVQTFPQIQSTSGELMGTTQKDLSIGWPTSLIPSGGRKLFSFDNQIDQIFNNLRMSNGEGFTQPDQIKRAVEGVKDNSLKIATAYKGVSVSIDGLFFNDGTFVGEDTFFYFDRMRGRLEARNDFISSLRNAMSEGRQTEVLTNFVVQHSSKPEKENRNIAPNAETAFQKGYRFQTRSLSNEIARKRERFSDQSIVLGYVSDSPPNGMKLRKLN
jgi:hypothetical protein